MPANLEDSKKSQVTEQTFTKKHSGMYSKQEKSKSSISKSFNQNMTSNEFQEKSDEFEEDKVQDEVYYFINNISYSCRMNKKLRKVV